MKNLINKKLKRDIHAVPAAHAIPAANMDEPMIGFLENDKGV